MCGWEGDSGMWVDGRVTQGCGLVGGLLEDVWVGG